MERGGGKPLHRNPGKVTVFANRGRDATTEAIGPIKLRWRRAAQQVSFVP